MTERESKRSKELDKWLKVQRIEEKKEQNGVGVWICVGVSL